MGVLILFIVLAVVGLVLVAGLYLKYLAAERRALLWALSVAAERGIPLEQAARAFVAEHWLPRDLRASRLAVLLEAGAPLPQALDMAFHALPADVLLAARIGQETGQLGPALRICLTHSEQVAKVMRSELAKYLYFVGLLWTGLAIMTFMALKIIPVFVKIFAEFHLHLPAATQLTISVVEHIVRNPHLFVLPPFLLLTALLLPGVAYELGWSRYDLPVVHRLWLRRETALVLRALAFAVRQQRALGPTILMLARQYPKVSVARRLSRASTAIQQGLPWCEALRRAGLIRESEAGVLRAAERVGNVAWALDEMADSTWRRFVMWLRVTLGVLSPIGVLVLGLGVASFVIGMFLPLISLIQGLS